ncbi:inner nuclear membrane protein enriched at telomere/subtelomere region [Stygiomarasmius scandens]|uniref:Inner nuclear membrane protein enriched at telomere/subtelomere region n=1 Tax=Marasmiellus scandens TaxID=2682957 RepID=A0ABR1JU70_9AGAR
MSTRLTAAQLVAQGGYLEPDFEPSSLTVSQLLGILGYHNIVYPTPYTKPKLVQVFNDEIKKRASKLKKERMKKENSIASDEGIKDGITGELISGKAAPTRRSSRRLSRAPLDEVEETEAEPPRPDPPKRRRSSAQPRLGGTSRKSQLPVEPPVQEESEPEDDIPVRKVSKTKKADAAGRQSRRVSHADDSGWEDNNIFQSGAESSSPMRPSPVRAKPRRSTAPRKSRKSMSAPPQISPPSSPPKVSRFPVSPPQSRFEPELPDFGTPSTRRSSGMGVGPSTPLSPTMMTKEEEEGLEAAVSPRDYVDTVESVHFDDDGEEELGEEHEEEQEEERVEEEEEEEGEIDYNAVVQQRIADGGQDLALVESDDEENLALSKPTSPLAHVFRMMLFGVLVYLITDYKKESASIGYCDTGSNTNGILEDLRTTRHAIELCNKENRTTLYDNADSPACPLLPIIPFPRPDSCTPCPDHAMCSGHEVTCEKAYTLRPPLLLPFLPPPPKRTSEAFSLSLPPSELVWRAISELTDGLPGLGPVGIVPRCVEDPRRKRHIGVLGKAIESWLALERGTRLCTGDAERLIPENDGGEAKRWGLRLAELRDRARQAVGSDSDLAHLDDLFNEAVQQLLQWGGVLMSEDSSGERYLAHKTPSMSLTCQLTVKFRNFWVEWRATLAAIVSLIGAIWANRSRRAQKKVEGKRVAELVQIALETLRHQEMAHHTDPVTAPEPFLSSLQLRDLVLQDEHSVAARKRVWDQVEKVVESNANVRANLEELEGGDELRVWRWVGSAGRGRASLSLGDISAVVDPEEDLQE